MRMRCIYCKEFLNLMMMEDEEIRKIEEKYPQSNICNKCILKWIHRTYKKEMLK